MVQRAGLMLILAALGLSLTGCGPCGLGFSGWDAPMTCRNEPSPLPK